MKRNIFLPLIALSLLLIAGPVLAAEEESQAGIVTFINLVTLVVVGGIIYNIFAGVGGFGGVVGKALKTIGFGILILSINVIDEVIESLAGFGSETILGEGLVHDVFHEALPLLGFIVLAFGLSKLTKFIKTIK